MKISILTPTYNRAKLLNRLYTSLIINAKYGVEIEWLIMDDGSTDETKQVVEEFQKENIFQVQYERQENQGKMAAINQIVEKATGDFIIECDSDDYFTEDAFLILKNVLEKYKDRKDLYAVCFLKQDEKGNCMGKPFPKEETTMFDLYFKQGEDGEKALVFFAPIRKKYRYILEEGERFSTEARMFHQMDLQYHMACVNQTIMICEYQEAGYTKNIEKQFKENPKGYYEYFKEMFLQDMSHILWKKRLYLIKHYILFSVLTKQKKIIKPVKGIVNKGLVCLLYLPGKIMTKKRFMEKLTS